MIHFQKMIYTMNEKKNDVSKITEMKHLKLYLNEKTL